MQTGEFYPVSVTFKNTGRSIWYQGFRLISREKGFYLSSKPSESNSLTLSHSVLPGESVTFKFLIRTFSIGLYRYQWALVKPFGNNSIGTGGRGSVEVTVASEPSSCSDLKNSLAQKKLELSDVQAELSDPEGRDKSDIITEINRIKAEITAIERSMSTQGCALICLKMETIS